MAPFCESSERDNETNYQSRNFFSKTLENHASRDPGHTGEEMSYEKITIQLTTTEYDKLVSWCSPEMRFSDGELLEAGIENLKIGLIAPLSNITWIPR